jgi:hypothetical protein
MSDRAYLILQNRIERRLEKSRTLIPHMALFTLYSVIFGTVSITMRPMGNMDGVIYWSIFAWSVLVSMHTLYTYMRSGAWTATRERLVYEEVLEAGDEFHLSSEEMIDLHERLSDSIRKRSSTFNKLAAVGAGYFLLWPGSLIFLLILKWLIVGDGLPEDSSTLTAISQIWQPLSLLGMLLLSMLLIPWRALLPQAKSRSDLYALYQGKSKRGAQLTIPEGESEIDEEGEILPEYEEKYRQNSTKDIRG